MNSKNELTHKTTIAAIIILSGFLAGCGGPEGAKLPGPVPGTMAEGAAQLTEPEAPIAQGAGLEGGTGFNTPELPPGAMLPVESGATVSKAGNPASYLTAYNENFAQENTVPNLPGSSFDTAGLESQETLVAGPAMHTSNPKTAASLDTINFAEGKPGPNQTYGYQNFSTPTKGHPQKLVCKSRCSDAAGEYQIMSPTYKTYASKAGVSGFSKPEQEKLATYLMTNVRGANPNKIKDFATFKQEFGKLCYEWASIPCPNGRGAYGQPNKTWGELWKVYQESLDGRM